MVAPGEIIFKKEDRDNRIFFVYKGLIELYVNKNDHETIQLTKINVNLVNY